MESSESWWIGEVHKWTSAATTENISIRSARPNSEAEYSLVGNGTGQVDGIGIRIKGSPDDKKELVIKYCAIREKSSNIGSDIGGAEIGWKENMNTLEMQLEILLRTGD